MAEVVGRPKVTTFEQAIERTAGKRYLDVTVPESGQAIAEILSRLFSGEITNRRLAKLRCLQLALTEEARLITNQTTENFTELGKPRQHIRHPTNRSRYLQWTPPEMVLIEPSLLDSAIERFLQEELEQIRALGAARMTQTS